MTRHTVPATLALALLAASCDDASPTRPPAFASCTDRLPLPGGDEDLFRTPEERARAEAEARRLGAVQERHADEVFAIPGVIGFGVSYDVVRGEFVFVVTWDERGACPRVPARIEGVPVWLEPGLPAVPQSSAR